MSDKKIERREFLFTASYAVGAIGVGAVVWPLVDQMNPDASVKAMASTEVDISSLQLQRKLQKQKLLKCKI
jgi:ubiquinol-cytochrome c reductase iron-sulfur subunit